MSTLETLWIVGFFSNPWVQGVFGLVGVVVCTIIAFRMTVATSWEEAVKCTLWGYGVVSVVLIGGFSAYMLINALT